MMNRTRYNTLSQRMLALAAVGAAMSGAVNAQTSTGPKPHFFPGNLVVTRSYYDNNPKNVTVGQVLPPNCASTQGGCAGTSGAPFDGTYPYVFNNASYDSSFGITSVIFLDQRAPFSGKLINSIQAPNSKQRGITPVRNQMVTSFPSKSELNLHLSLDNNYITFMGYVAPVNALDVSNSNTPGAVDPTNPVGDSYSRTVAQVDQYGHFHFTETNAYSGNNGRSAIWNNVDGANYIYTAGNAGNGANPQPENVILGAGAQILDASTTRQSLQDPGTPKPVGSFNITQLGVKKDKIGKDDNFRGATVFNNVLYYTKGSGGNGVNTVYFLDTTGAACPNGGVGLPVAGATLPTAPLTYDPMTVATNGLPSNMCILAGFPAVPVKTATTVAYPFGLFFANDHTLYVADEGDEYAGGADLYTHAAAQTTAGLQKWILNDTTHQWALAYTLQEGLELGKAYTVPGYPKGSNATTGLPWAPATDGLRSLHGYVTPGGIVYLWAITSTVSGAGDTGADPNRLVAIADDLSNTSPTFATYEQFYTLYQSASQEVLRGVTFTPGTTAPQTSYQ